MSADDDHCHSYRYYTEIANEIAYNVVTPFYFIFGGAGHLVCLIAFYQQRKKDKAYMYQVFVVVSETIEIVAFTAYTTTFFWFSGMDGVQGASWFMSCYPCMWYTARLVIPVVNMFITSTLLFSITVAADRVFAMTKPFIYSKLNHARHQAVALVACYFISVATSIFDFNRFMVVEKVGNGTADAVGSQLLNSTDAELLNSTDATIYYDVAFNAPFVHSAFGRVPASLRTFTRTFGVLVLFCLNVTMVVKYRQRMQKVKSISIADEAAETRRRNTERVLTLLAIMDSAMNAIKISMIVTYQGLVYVAPGFFYCEGPLVEAVADAITQLLDIGDFYLAFAISKQFRVMIASVPAFARLFKAPASTKDSGMSKNVIQASCSTRKPEAPNVTQIKGEAGQQEGTT